MLAHFLGLVLVAIVAVVSYILIRYPHLALRNVLNVNALGQLEGSLTDLQQVLVVADHVEDPRDELRRAVERNLKRGVKYQFLVSQSKAQQELKGYYRIFEVLAQIVSSRSVQAGDLVTIQQLPYDWVEVPYVFYQVQDRSLPSGIRYIAIRGNQRREGIADFYTFVESDYAHMVARGILSDGPSPINVQKEQFRDSNVVELNSALRARQRS